MVESSMDINKQIKYLEAFLKRPENAVCADCYGKSPRWASITFGVFVCIRCSGEHRRLGVHITKIKSVNLDKWPDGKVALFSESNNLLMNAYWEANIPSNFQKPLMNTSSDQVRAFLTDKYVNKRWVNSKMKHEPVWLYQNRKSKYDRFVKKTMKAIKGDVSEEEDDSDAEEKPAPVKEVKKVQVVQQKPKPTPAPAKTTQMDNLISFESKQPSVIDDFTNFQSSDTSNNNNDGFTNFQGSEPQQVQQQQQQNQSTDLISNLTNLYAQGGVNTGNNKFAAFDAMNIGNTNQQQNSFMPMAQQQQQPQQQQQTTQGGFQPMGFTQMQQQQQQQQHQQQQQQQQQQFNFLQQQRMQQQPFQAQQQQPMFNNNVPNLQQPQFVQQSQSFPQGNTTPQSNQQQQIYFKGAMKNDRQAQSLDGGFDDFQTAQPTNNPPVQNFYGGLVNLTEIQNKNNAPQQNNMSGFQPNNNTQNQNFDSLVKW